MNSFLAIRPCPRHVAVLEATTLAHPEAGSAVPLGQSPPVHPAASSWVVGGTGAEISKHLPKDPNKEHLGFVVPGASSNKLDWFFLSA